MNEELEVRESSLSYVIGSMNNNWTRKSGDNDPCGKEVWYSAVCYGEKTEMRGHVGRC